MSEQANILAKMQELVMRILKNGSATVEEGNMIDELEDLLHQQNCYKEVKSNEYSYQGEEITGLFLKDSYKEAIEKMYSNEITPDDFFDFVEYHYEDDDFSDTFTELFIADVKKVYLTME